MEGVLKVIRFDEKTGHHFGIQLGENIFAVSDDQVDLRMLNEKAEVSFHTDKETGRAILDNPPPVIGCERALR